MDEMSNACVTKVLCEKLDAFSDLPLEVEYKR